MTTPPQAASPAIEQAVAAEQVRALFGGIRVMSVGAPVSAAMLALLMWPAVDHRNTIVWLSVFVLLACPINLALHHHFQKNHRLPGDAARWLRVYTLRQVATSAVAGFASIVLWVPDSLQYQLILLCYLVIACAMITMEIAYHRRIYWITLCAFLAPFIVRAGIEPASRVIALCAAIVLVYLLLNARAANRLILESLRLRFLNQGLVEQLQSEKAVAESARVEAVEANRAKSRFLAAASHDLRQPMVALGLFAHAVRPHIVGEAGLHVADKIELSIASTETLFNALLDVSLLDAGVLTPDIKPLAVDALLNRLAAEYAPRAEEKGLQLRVSTSAHNVMSDAFLLERVLRNYLSNAIRYTQRGGIVVGCRVRGAMLSIEVWDTARA
jgi:two-component system, sensor histidine kinase